MLACGPLSREQYDQTVSRQDLKSSNSLKKCNFSLSISDEESGTYFNGDVYVSPITKRLFLAVSVTDIMIDGICVKTVSGSDGISAERLATLGEDLKAAREENMALYSQFQSSRD